MSRNRWIGADASGPLVAVACWCDTTIVTVPRSEFLAGKTRSCGDPMCCEAVAKRAADLRRRANLGSAGPRVRSNESPRTAGTAGGTATTRRRGSDMGKRTGSRSAVES